MDNESDNDQNDTDYEDYETLSAAIALEQEKCQLEEHGYKTESTNDELRRTKKFKKSTYFSDEEEIE